MLSQVGLFRTRLDGPTGELFNPTKEGFGLNRRVPKGITWYSLAMLAVMS